MTGLKRTLGLAECVFFGVGSILGAGIYALVGKVAGVSGNLIWLAFIIAALTAVFTAFSYAELSAAFPRAGGEYVYVRKAFGERTGMILGFLISLNGMISGATVAVGFAGYMMKLAGFSILIASLGIILLIFVINISGIRESSTVNIIFTIIEAAGLVMIIIAALNSFGSVDYFQPGPDGFNGILMASALAFFAFIGFEEIVKLAEETREPEKNIPRALFITSAIVVVIYCAVALSAVSVIPFNELGESGSPLSDVAESRYGSAGAIIISVIALFSTANTILSNMLGSSRVLYNMSEREGLFKIFSYILPGRKTPAAALIFILIVMSAFALIGEIEIIARIATMFIFTTFIIINVTVIVLRIKQKNVKRPYRIPLNISNIPIISIAGIIMTLILLIFNILSF